LFGPDKPFGTIKYYRKPYTMEKNIEKAIELYSGDKPFGLFVPKLEENIEKMDYLYRQILELFKEEGIEDFSNLPKSKESRRQFVSLFNEFNRYLEAARIQGYKFDSEFRNVKNNNKNKISDDEYIDRVAEESEKYILCEKAISEEEFNALKQRYKEISGSSENKNNEAPYDIEGYITELDPIKVNKDYMNSKFVKYLRSLQQENISEEELNKNLNELHKSFSTLTQEEQKYANIFIHDIQSGNVEIIEGKDFIEYITEYQRNAENDIIRKISDAIGVDENKLRNLLNSNVDETNINEFGRFDDLVNTVNIEKAKKYFENIGNREIPIFEVNMKVNKLLRKFVIDGTLE
jgi:type I restriction enzyme R subunit